MRVEVSPTADDAAEAAAVAFGHLIEAAVDARGVAVIALSGGSTPRPMFRRLASLPLPWTHVHLFQVDERAVPASSPSRNWLHQHDLAAHLPATNQHPMPVEHPDGEKRYGNALHRIAGSPPVLDVVHLGLGDDGHTASLFPDDPVLATMDRDVSWTQEHRGNRRMTLTRPTLARARQQIWLATGEAKAPVAAALEDPASSSPATLVARAGRSVALFVDERAAALLRHSSPDAARDSKG